MYGARRWFFAVTLFYVVVRAVRDQLLVSLPFVANFHHLITFLGFVVGLVLYVLHLRRPQYKSQLKHLAHTGMALILVVAQLGFIVHSMFNGIFWCVRRACVRARARARARA
jgi:hypothetical protein